MTRSILLCLLLAGCASSSRRASDEAQLLAMHKAVLQAHLESNVDALVADQADDFTMVNRGEVQTVSKNDVRSFLGPYLARTRFTAYRDLVPPTVKVSPDGRLGWVIAKIEAVGAQGNDPLTFVSAWIELYEKRDGRWYAVGNVSNFKP